MPQTKKGLQKGRHFRKDECSLPVLLLYLFMGPSDSNHRRRIELHRRQGKGRRVGLGDNPFRSSCFATVFLKQMIEFNF